MKSKVKKAAMKKAAMNSLKKDSSSSLKKNSSSSLRKDEEANLNAANLKKLGQLSLKDKIQKAAEEHSGEEDQANALVASMTAGEKSNAWNQHQVHLKRKGNESLKKEFEGLDKKAKGLSTALFLMKKNKAVFASVVKEASHTSSLKKKERWLTELEALKKWTQTELDAHCASGRVIWRNCPTTWGVYEYQDTLDIVKTVKGTHRASWAVGQEYEVGAEDEDDWQQALEKDPHSLMLGGLEKGKGAAGKGLEKGKTKGKGKGKTKPQPVEDEDQEDEEELTMEKALKKAKKTRDLLSSTQNNFEEALKKVAKSPYLSKQSYKDKQAVLSGLGKMLAATKKILEKGESNKLDAVKEHLLAACACMKEAKEEAKELVQLGMKALSKAGSAKDKP